MVASGAQTVAEYLDELPPDRREVVSAVREVILSNLPEGYREDMSWGMIGYEVPLETYPTTYNGRPLGYVALAAQKNNYALYLNSVYMDPDREQALRDAFARKGSRLDMGKSCLRFRKLDDLPLDVIGEIVAATPVSELIATYEKSRQKK